MLRDKVGDAVRKIKKWVQKKDIAIVVITALVLFVFVGLFLGYKIVKSYNAVDVIGQNDSSGAIEFDSMLANNALPAANTVFAPSQMIIDTTTLRMFVADSSNNRVLIYNLNADGSLIDKNADIVLGQADMVSAMVATTQSGMYKPIGLALDSVNKRLFVADQGNNRILVFNVDPSVIRTGENADIVLGQADFSGKTAGDTQTSINTPYQLAYDSVSSTLFVADYGNHRILVFDVTTSTIASGENASYVIGQSDFTSKATGRSATAIYWPRGVVVDENGRRLFVADWYNNRVIVFNLNNLATNMSADNVLGQADLSARLDNTTSQTVLYRPTSLVFNSASNTLYVLDFSNSRVVFYDVTNISNGESMINVLGQPDFTSKATSASRNTFKSLGSGGLAYNALNANLYVSEFSAHRIMIFDLNEAVNGEDATDLIGQYDSGGAVVWTTYNGNNQSPNSLGFTYVEKVVFDTTNHRAFVGDASNHRVLVFNLNSSNQFVDKQADFVLGQSDFSFNTNTTTATGLNAPRDLDFDPVRKLLFVADMSNNRVVIYDVNDISNGEPAAYILGQTTPTSSAAGSSSSTMSGPIGLYYDSVSSSLYVTEGTNNRVTVFNLTSIAATGQSAVNVLGQTVFDTAGSSVSQSRMSRPDDAVMDSNRNLYIADNANARVLVFNVSSTISNGQNAINVLGQSSFGGNTAAITQTGMSSPFSLALDDTHKILYVSDLNGRRVMGYDVNTITDNEPAVLVLGQDNYTSSVLSIDQSHFSYPYDLSYDVINNYLYVSDYTGSRLLIYKMVVPNSSSFVTAYYGLNYTASAITSAYGQGSVSYAVTSGTLPTGLSLATSTGIISGIPTATGVFSFGIQATDANSIGSFYGENNYSLTVGVPTVQFSTTTASNTEDSTSTVYLEVSLPATSTFNVTVDYNVYGGAATYNTDYTVSTGTLTIVSGTLSAFIPVNIVSDTVMEGDETFQISISNPTNSALGSNTVFTYTILNDDVAKGGGLPPTALAEIALPSAEPNETEGSFKVFINQEVPRTNKNIVNLTYNATKEITGLALSRSADFSTVSIEPFEKQKKWNLCTTEICPSGIYRVYVKFYNMWGKSTEPFWSEIELVDTATFVAEKVSLPELEIKTVILPESIMLDKSGIGFKKFTAGILPNKFYFLNNLIYNSSLQKEVRYMQIYLRDQGYDVVPTGIFDVHTIKIVKQFQIDKGIKKPNGTFGPATRSFVNADLKLSRSN